MGKAERTRQFIIETAAPIFNRKGIAGTTIDDILTATKMAKGGLYGHFESKDEIATVMVDYLLNKLDDKIASVIAKEKTALKKIFAFIDIYKDPLNSYIGGGCPVLNFGVECDDTDSVIKQKVKEVIDGGQHDLIAIINQGVADMELSAVINAEESAVMVFAMLEGGMMMSRVTGNVKYMHKIIKMLKANLKSYELNK